jgi:hypothetical protein
MIKQSFSISLLLSFKAFVLSAVLFLFSLQLAAQPPQFKMQVYIEKYGQEAIHQMIQYKIPASVILAQAIFESRSGGSELAKKSNNHFGIKCHVGWGGDTIIKTDDTLNECFRKYLNIEESYKDHSLFLISRPRYAHLFNLSITDYKAWCYGLKNAGYATYPSYAEELIKIIEQTKLYELDGYENLSNGFNFSVKKQEPVLSRLQINNFTLKDFSKGGFLWLNEKDVLIRSLDLIIEERNESEIEIAEK